MLQRTYEMRDRCTYICNVSQLDLQLGLRGLRLRSHRHGDDLGVHDRVIPARKKSENRSTLGNLMTLIQTVWHRLAPAEAEARVQEYQETTPSFKC